MVFRHRLERNSKYWARITRNWIIYCDKGRSYKVRTEQQKEGCKVNWSLAGCW